MRFLQYSLLALLLAAPLMAQSNLALNPGFERPLKEGWGIFIPGEAKDKGCTLTNGPGRSGLAAVLDAPVATRYALGGGIKSTNEGARFRVRVWVKAAADAEALGDTVGVVMRVIFADPKGKDLRACFALPNGQATMDYGKLEKTKIPLPRDWKLLEMVVDAPPGTASLNYNLFSWRSKGKLYWDDFSIERVGKEVPLSPFQ